MGVEAGVVLPHAPLIAKGDRADLDLYVRSAREAIRALDGCDVVVLLASHGPRDGVYTEVAGDLDAFGVQGVAVDVLTESGTATELADAWARDQFSDRADHGVVGTLAIVAPTVPLVACTLAEITGPYAHGTVESAVEAAFLFADALQQIAGERRVGFIASAHTAASLTPKAPLALKPEGKELDDLILDCLATDCGSLARVDPELWKEAGACGAGPLTAFGALFEGVRADVHAYDHPFGVGYLVASISHG
jgi:aromatic ring-opening dioxygenase LigB subunit